LVRAIYKICTVEEWANASRIGKFTGSEVDRRDGFIHFSTREQLAETAAKHFYHLHDLVLVMVDAGQLGALLKWEPSRGGAHFPHLYAPLDTAVVKVVTTLPDGEARAEFLSNLPDEADAGNTATRLSNST